MSVFHGKPFSCSTSKTTLVQIFWPDRWWKSGKQTFLRNSNFFSPFSSHQVNNGFYTSKTSKVRTIVLSNQVTCETHKSKTNRLTTWHTRQVCLPVPEPKFRSEEKVGLEQKRHLRWSVSQPLETFLTRSSTQNALRSSSSIRYSSGVVWTPSCIDVLLTKSFRTFKTSCI